MIYHALLPALCCLLLSPYVTSDLLLTDQCYYDEIPNFSLQEVREPARTLQEYIGEDWLTDRYDCYKMCCDDKFQIGTIGKCSAAAFYMGEDNKLVCKLLECEPADHCLWSPGKTGKYSSFIRSTKTTTTTTTTTPAPTTTQQVYTYSYPNSTEDQGNRTNNVNNGTNQTEHHDTESNKSSNANTDGEMTGDPQTQAPFTTGMPAKNTDASWSHNRPGTGGGNKPDTVHIEPMKKSHQVPIKGLIAGIVVAVLLIIVLVIFLAKNLKSLREPVHYKPIREEEYQKLTLGEET